MRLYFDLTKCISEMKSITAEFLFLLIVNIIPVSVPHFVPLLGYQ